MAINYSALRGRMVERCGTVANCCREMDFDTHAMYAKLNHNGFTVSDIVKISEHLEITKEEIGKYFFTQDVKKSEREEV